MSRTAAKAATIYRMDLAGEATFGTEPGGSIFDYIRTTGVQLALDMAASPNAVQRQVDGPLERIIGRNTGTMTTTHYLHGFASADPAAAPSANHTGCAHANAHGHDFLRQILASAIGNIKASAGYDSTATGLGSSGVPVDTLTLTDITTFTVGEAIAWKSGNANLPYVVGWLKAINTTPAPDTGTLLQTTPFAAPGADGDDVWGAYNIFTPSVHTADLDPYHNTGLSGQTNYAKSWTARLIGLDADDYIECYGMRPTQIKIRPLADIPEFEVTWAIAHWDEPGSGGAPSIGTWAFPEPENAIGNCWFAWGDTHSNGSQGGSLPVMDFEVTITCTRPEQKDPSAASGVGGWPCTGRTVEATMTIYRDVSEEVTLYDAQTPKPFTFQMGSQPGKIIAMAIPNARVVSYPGRGESDGLVTTSVTLSADFYNGDSMDTNGGGGDDVSRTEITPVNSSFRLAFI